jgi:hypothetical protein
MAVEGVGAKRPGGKAPLLPEAVDKSEGVVGGTVGSPTKIDL